MPPETRVYESHVRLRDYNLGLATDQEVHPSQRPEFYFRGSLLDALMPHLGATSSGSVILKVTPNGIASRLNLRGDPALPKAVSGHRVREELRVILHHLNSQLPNITGYSPRESPRIQLR